MTSIWPVIPALFLILLASYYSQNYAGILASPLLKSIQIEYLISGSPSLNTSVIISDSLNMFKWNFLSYFLLNYFSFPSYILLISLKFPSYFSIISHFLFPSYFLFISHFSLFSTISWFLTCFTTIFHLFLNSFSLISYLCFC